MNERFRNALIVLIAVPVLGLLMGGVYSVPAMRISNCREPWLTILLGVGLSFTVVTIGFAADLKLPLIVGAWMFGCVVLLVRRSFGKLDHNLERFGLIHGVIFVGMFCLAWFVA